MVSHNNKPENHRVFLFFLAGVWGGSLWLKEYERIVSQYVPIASVVIICIQGK